MPIRSQNISLAPKARAFSMYSRAILPPPTTTIDLVLCGQLLEGLGVLLEALCIAARHHGAAEGIDEYHGEGQDVSG